MVVSPSSEPGNETPVTGDELRRFGVRAWNLVDEAKQSVRSPADLSSEIMQRATALASSIGRLFGLSEELDQAVNGSVCIVETRISFTLREIDGLIQKLVGSINDQDVRDSGNELEARMEPHFRALEERELAAQSPVEDEPSGITDTVTLAPPVSLPPLSVASQTATAGP